MDETPTDEQARRERFAAILSEAITAKGLPLDAISTRLGAAGAPVSSATLSYWQNGRSMPTRGRSLTVLPLLEHILDLETGTLGELLSGGVRPEWQMPNFHEPGLNVDDVLREWGLALRGMNSQRVVQRHWTINANLLGNVERYRCVYQVEWEVVRAIPVVMRDLESAQLPDVEPLHGCRVGRTATDESTGLRIAEMLLDRPYQRGELFWTEMDLHWHAAHQERRQGMATNLMNLTPMATLDITFRGEAPEVVRYGIADQNIQGDDDEIELCRLPVRDKHAGIVLPNAPAGLHWLSWE